LRAFEDSLNVLILEGVGDDLAGRFLGDIDDIAGEALAWSAGKIDLAIDDGVVGFESGIDLKVGREIRVIKNVELGSLPIQNRPLQTSGREVGDEDGLEGIGNADTTGHHREIVIAVGNVRKYRLVRPSICKEAAGQKSESKVDPALSIRVRLHIRILVLHRGNPYGTNLSFGEDGDQSDF